MHFSLALLGSFAARLDGEPITRFESARIRVLLAYLAVEAGRPLPRETLADLFWPNWPAPSALANLRHALGSLRRALREERAARLFLLATRETVTFDSSSDYDLDAARFQALLGPRATTAELEQAVDLYRGPFLEGLTLADSPAFEEWALLRRESYARQMLAALQRLGEGALQRKESEQAEGYARRQLELDPLSEESHRQVMRALAAAGRRSEALAHYQACSRLLQRELGTDPDRETTALYRAIREGKLGGQVAQAVAPAPDMAAAERDVGPEAEPPLFVGREDELAHLDGWLGEALAGHGRAGFVLGEPGVGKTLLLQAFARRAMAAHPDLIVASGACNAYSGLGDPYLPFVEILGLLAADVEARLAGGGIGREQARRLRALFPAVAQALLDEAPGLVDTLVSGADLVARAPAPWQGRLEELRARGAPQLTQTMLFQQTTRLFQALARGRPLLLIVDDLQWADNGTIALLFHLGRRLAGSRLLVLGAYRPEEVAAGREGQRHPLEAALFEFEAQWGDVRLDLAQADGRRFAELLVDSESNALGAAFREALYQHTGGQALFTVELLRGLQERGDLRRDGAGRWVEGQSLAWERLPRRVEAVIAAHIGRLPEAWRELLTAAAVEGEEFTAEVLARALGLEEREVVRLLGGPLRHDHRLTAPVSAGRMGERSRSRYRFRHALFQQYLYQQLDEARRARLHEAVGLALEALYVGAAPQPLLGIDGYNVALWITGAVDLDAARSRPEEGLLAAQLARHFEAAGLIERAVTYQWLLTNLAEIYISSEEGIACDRRQLEMLSALPPSPLRTFHEASARISLGVDTCHSRGYLASEVLRSYERAYELAQQFGNVLLLCVTLRLCAEACRDRGELARARWFNEQCVSLAQDQERPTQLWARGDLAWTLLLQGDFAGACERIEPLYAPCLESPPHPLRALFLHHYTDVACAAQAFWYLGYPDRAWAVCRAALDLARTWPIPSKTIWVLCLAGCFLPQLARDAPAAEEALQELERLDREGWCMPLLQPHVALVRGWVDTQHGALDRGIETLRRGVAGWSAVYMSLRPYRKGYLAEALGRAGQVEEGLALLDEGLAQGAETGERFAEAELLRLKGELLRQRGDDTEAVEACYRQAIAVAQGQQAKSWELRATLSLARLLRDQGRAMEARDTLAAVYGWFTEGFDTADLVDAKALLDELAQEIGGRALHVVS